MFLSLAAANVGYTNSSEGLNPGQVSAEDREQLKNVIDAAQLVFDNVASTPAEIDAAKGEVDAIFAMFKTQVITPELSTTTDNWYYIRGTRYANTYLTAGAAGSVAPPTNVTLVPNDFQLWKLVSNTNGTANGFALVNKATGEYIDTDQARVMNMITTMPLNNLRFIPHTSYINNSLLFRVENAVGSAPVLRMHSDSDSKAIVNWTGDQNVTCDWLFVSYDEIFRTQFAEAITTAHDLYVASASNLGDAFGQYSSATRITFAAVIATADALQTSTMSQDELFAAKTTLDNATTAFTVNADVTLLSSATQLKWFRFVNAMSPAGYATGKAMTSNARILDQAFTYETVDAVSDAQLFRFEMNGDYSKATTLVNKANGLYVSATGTMVAAPADVNEFEITPLDGFSFWIKPTTQAPLHAAAFQTDIVNWNSGAGSASAWKIEYVKSEPNTADLNPAYTAALLQSRNYYNITSGGTEYGQYPLVARTSFNAVIATEEAKTQSTLTHQQLGDGINAITDASKSYKASLNATLDAAKWYSLESVKVPGKFLNVDPVTNAISCEAASITDNQKFHFVAKPSIGMYKNLYEISSKSVPTGSIRCENAAWDVNYNTGTVFSAGATAIALGYWPWNATLSFGVSGSQTLLQSLDGDGVGTDDGVAVINKIEAYNGASAWRIVVADGANAIAVTDSNADISISIKNRMIIVSGSEATVKVFTISGIQVNATKALYPGIYLVKVNNIVKKVIVE